MLLDKNLLIAVEPVIDLPAGRGRTRTELLKDVQRWGQLRDVDQVGLVRGAVQINDLRLVLCCLLLVGQHDL